MEEVLVRRLQAGDEGAFDELFALYQKQAVRTAALITGDVAQAEDVAQETFVLCLLHINDLREPSRFRPWFFRTLTRSAWKVMQNKLLAIDLRNLPEMAAETEPYPSEKAAAYEKLYRALDGLGRKQRTTVILYYFNDLSIKEIAEATGTLESTVKTRLFAARRRLKQVLEAKDHKGGVVYE